MRPIQKDLSIAPTVAESTSEVTEKCHGCGQDILVRKLRKHIWTCSQQLLMESDDDEDDGLPQTFLYAESPPEITQEIPNSNLDREESTDRPTVVVIDPPIVSCDGQPMSAPHRHHLQ